MGIFERSIPKYTYNLANEVVVEPQDVYVDDIFDPIFNARVKDAMRQKYGDGLYGVVGGYEELWKNTWTGREGILGPGMGLLSTFGRSMEKADDIVLGALTEGIKALSFQGATNPIENIFVNDHDYTGRGLLAATANIGSRLVGTEVDESDFGSAWTLPALGLELGTDVGILGGTLSRNLAPNASKLTSKQLFENLGKSDLKTSVGEMGQLMSNYDDLMTKIALDVSAPGLRPAMKVLMNRIAELVKHQSPNTWAEVTKNLHTVEDTSADPAVRRDAQKQLQEDETVVQLTTLFQEPKDALAHIPEDTYEAEIFDMGAEEPTINRLAAAMQLDLEDAHNVTSKKYAEAKQRLKDNIAATRARQHKKIFEAFAEMQKEARALNWHTDASVLSKSPIEAMPIVASALNDVPIQYSQDILDILNEAAEGNTDRFMAALSTGKWSPYEKVNKIIEGAIEHRAPHFKPSPYRVSPSLMSAVKETGTPGVMYAYNEMLKPFKDLGVTTAKELDELFQRSDIYKSLEEFIPVKKLSSKDAAGLSPEDASKKAQAFARGNRSKFIRLLKEVLFPYQTLPAKKHNTFDYTKSLIALEEFLIRNVNANVADPNAKFLKTLTPEELSEFKAHPERVLSLKKFLEYEGLTKFDESGVILSADPAARFLIEGKLPSNKAYQVPTLRKARALSKRYDANLKEISDAIDNVSNTSFTANAFFDKIYDTVDDISQTYLQPLRDQMPRPIKQVLADVELDKPIGTDGTSTIADFISDDAPYIKGTPKSVAYGKNRLDDENSLAISRSISDYIKATVPADANVDDFRRFIRPMAPYMDIGYKSDIDVPVTKHTETVVNTFYNDIVPLIETISKNPQYSNMYFGKVLATDAAKENFKNVPQDVVDAIKKLRNYIGAPLATSKNSDARLFNRMYREVVASISKDSFKFAAAHPSAEVSDLTEFFRTPKTPSEIIKELTPRFNTADMTAWVNEQGSFNLNTLIERFYKNTSELMSDLEISEADLESIISTARSKGSSALSKDQLNIYRAYVQEMSKILRETPYKVYGRRAVDWSSATSWRGVQDIISRKYPGHQGFDGLHKASKEWIRTDKLMTRELKQSLDSTRKVPFYYTSDDLAFVREKIIPYTPENVRGYWNPSHKKGLFNFDLPKEDEAYTFQLGMDIDLRPGHYQLERFIEEFKGDMSKVNDFKYTDYGLLYTASGRKKLTNLVANERLRMDLIGRTPLILEDVSKRIFDRSLSTAKTTEALPEIPEAIVTALPEEVAELAYDVPSIVEETVDDIMEKILGEEAARYSREGGSEDPESFKALHGDRHWSLFEQISKAMAVSSKNSFRKKRATLELKPTRALLDRALSLRGDHLVNGGKMSDFRRFVALRQQPYGDIVQGKDFWDELRHSGMLGAVYAKGSASADGVFDSLTKNANIINELVQHPIVKVVREDIPNGKEKIYLQFVKNKKGVVWINAAADKLEKAAFETVTFSPPKAWTTEDLAFMNSDTMRELSAIMDEAQVLAADQAKYLGFTFDTSSQYTKHAMRRNTDTALWFNDTFYKDFSSEDLDEFVNCISNLERYRKADHGAFGTTINTRRFRGDVWMMDDGPNVRFNYDPYEMITSTLADGTFANLQFQSYVDLFINDNFKIKEWFHSVDDLKEVLYKTTEDGRVSGNLRNLELCTMRLDANGKIIGLTKYDKLSDAGLQKALADENCILVPTNAVSHIDNLLKKDVRMSNKFWTFVNKHFTIPFKFGVLSNPGFLLGNMSDASLKLATTMSQKYGTTVKAEAARVAGCIQRAGKYKEDYGTAFEVWRKVSKDNGIKLSPEATIPDIVSMSPKYNEQFLEWLDGRLKVEKVVQDPVTGKIEHVEVTVPCDLSDNVKNAASTWVMLQTAQMNSSKLREFADIAGLSNTSEFEMPTNLWDRITQGKGKYDKHKPSTWGLFMNNPATSAMLNASTGWEDVIRTASILDDLEHGYTFEELGILSRASKGTQSDINFRVRLDEAKNTMYNAQFDYERGSDFMEGVGKAVPFPVFFLKNFAYWMELFAENPQYVDNAIDVQEGLWGNRDEENAKDTFAIEAKGRGAVPVGGESLPEWFKGYYKPAPLQSMFGAFNLLNDPVGNMQYRVNPLISSGIAAVNKAAPNELTTSLAPTEETKYRPYSTDMYERNVKASDPNFNPLEYAVHRANPYERALNSYLRVPHKIREGEVQMSDFAPSIFQPDF